jgi:hypothetical protein
MVAPGLKNRTKLAGAPSGLSRKNGREAMISPATFCAAGRAAETQLARLLD